MNRLWVLVLALSIGGGVAFTVIIHLVIGISRPEALILWLVASAAIFFVTMDDLHSGRITYKPWQKC